MYAHVCTCLFYREFYRDYLADFQAHTVFKRQCLTFAAIHWFPRCMFFMKVWLLEWGSGQLCWYTDNCFRVISTDYGRYETQYVRTHNSVFIPDFAMSVNELHDTYSEHSSVYPWNATLTITYFIVTNLTIPSCILHIIPGLVLEIGFFVFNRDCTEIGNSM